MKAIEGKMLMIILAIVLMAAIALLSYWMAQSGANPFRDFLSGNPPNEILKIIAGVG